MRRCDDCGEPKEILVLTAIRDSRGSYCADCINKEDDPTADRGDFEFHRDHDQ